ncbi:MAG TPA: hypothetical protein VF489_10075 [Sphingobium sp.]
MTRKSTRARQQSRADRRPEIHIPHSSWSRVQRVAPATSLAPEEFWTRLGLGL